MDDPKQHNMSNESDIESLVNRICDGTITPEERQELEYLLLNSSQARAIYLDYLAVNSSLAWKYRTGDAPVVAKSEVVSKPPQEETPERARTSSEAAEKNWLRVSSAFLAIAAGLLLAIVLWDRFDTDEDNIVAINGNQTAADAFIATLREASDAVWSNEDQAIDVGGRIEAGDLRIDAGEAELVFDSGAKLRIRGPAKLRLESPLLVQLERGTVAAHMPDSATGFEVRTPTSRLVDQGTEFGVVVDDSGSTEVHVFRGQVDVHYADGELGDTKLELFDRQARKIDRLGEAGEEILFSSSPFGELARRVAEPARWKVSVGGNDHYYQLVVEEKPITWHEAAQAAMRRHHRGMPGHLVTVTSHEEDQFVIEEVLSDSSLRGVWMGLTDSLREGHFSWVTSEPYDYTNWATFPSPQPDNFHEADWHGGEDYGMYAQFPGQQPWAWNDLSIDSMHEKVSAYLVEYEPPVDALRNGSMVLAPIHWSKEVGGNGHYYRVVLVLDPTNWENIRAAAEQSEVLGTQGHLVALETKEERRFVANDILRICGIPEMMIGLSGSLEQNDLRWVTGEPVTGFEVERSHLPTDHVYGVFRWNPAGKWQDGWEIRAMSKDVLSAGWFGYLIEYPVADAQVDVDDSK